MQGGTYINEGGMLRRVEGTDDHPLGNRARDADGARLNRLDEAGAVEPANPVEDRPKDQRRARAGGNVQPADAGKEG
jgi:hypothetical protein